MPRGGNCNHRRCDLGPCRQLTDEELTPTDEDLVVAGQLVMDGWLSVSTKYRTVALATAEVPTVQQIISPEYLDTSFGKDLAEYWHRHRINMLRTHAFQEDSPLVVSKELTLREWKAFKKLGGRSA